MTLLDFSLRLFVAILLGFLVGLERQLTSHPAGIRTNILVCIGACMFTMFSIIMGVADTTRVAAQVVTGIGFLCSGIILKEGLNVKGLNTAATIWCTAAIGVITSSGHLDFALAGTLMLLGSTFAFRFVSNKIQPTVATLDDEEYTYVLSATCNAEDEFTIRSLMIDYLADIKLQLINLQSAEDDGHRVEIKGTFNSYGKRRDELVEKLLSQLSLEKGVVKAGWKLI